MKNVTIKEVAKEAKVSISSVSRYLKDPSSIKPIAAVRVAQAIRDLNYVPSTFAQNLKRGHSNTIGIIVPRLTQYFSEACTALNLFYNQNGYLIIICSTEHNPERERYYIRQLIQQGVAGIIIASTDQNEETILECLNGFENVVYFVRPVPSAHFNSVNEDIVVGTYQLTTHLLQEGYRNLLLLANTTQYKNHVRKNESALKAVKDFGLSRDHVTMVSDLTDDNRTFRTIEAFVQQKVEDKCIISLSPHITENATIALGNLENMIHGKIGFGGFVFQNYRSRFRRDIPSYIQDPYEVGLRAGEVMLQILSKQKNAKKNVKEHLIENELFLP